MNQTAKPILANLILAVTNCGSVGYKKPVENKTGNTYLPWPNISDDMKYFSKVTKTLGGLVIMGYTTWMTLPEKYRILPDRTLVVLTRNTDNEQVLNSEKGVGRTIVTTSIGNINSICNSQDIKTVWVAGGPSIYSLFLDGKVPGFQLGELHRTLINADYICREDGVVKPQEETENFILMPQMVSPLVAYKGLERLDDKTVKMGGTDNSPSAEAEVFKFN